MSLILKRFLNKPFQHLRAFSQTQILNQGAEMVDPLTLTTGVQRKELEAYIRGECDPFNIRVIKRGPGTKDKPTIIPSAFTGRIVGCICCDNRFVNYMWIEKDCPKRCECGHWYKLQQVKALMDT